MNRCSNTDKRKKKKNNNQQNLNKYTNSHIHSSITPLYTTDKQNKALHFQYSNMENIKSNYKSFEDVEKWHV